MTTMTRSDFGFCLDMVTVRMGGLVAQGTAPHGQAPKARQEGP